MNSDSLKVSTRLASLLIRSSFPLPQPAILAAFTTTNSTSANHQRRSTYATLTRMPARRVPIDQADLIALEDSFTEDDDSLPGSRGNAIVLKSSPPKEPVVVQSSSPAKPPSPVKPHNQQFVNDFDSDLSDDCMEVDPPIPQKNSSRLSKLVRTFTTSSSPAASPQPSRGIKLSQIKRANTSLPKIQPTAPVVPPQKTKKVRKTEKLEDLEAMFADDLESQGSKASEPIVISAPETSSPTYHRIETLYPKLPTDQPRPVLIPQKVPTLAPPKLVTRQNSVLPDSTITPFFNPHSQPPRDPPLDEPLPEGTQPLFTSTPEPVPNQLYPKLTRSEPAVEKMEKIDEEEKENKSPNFASWSAPDMAGWTEKQILRYHFTGQKVDGSTDTAPDVLGMPLGWWTKFKRVVKEDPEPKVERPPQPVERSTRPIPAPPSMNQLQRLAKRPKLDTPQLILMTQRAASDASRKFATVTDAPQPKKVAAVALSDEQQHVLDLVMDGKSLFYTGSAGTGKSVLLREIIKKLRAKAKGDGQVAVTASTGLAACNIGGITLHSFSGIGLGQGTAQDLLKKIKRNRKSLNRWKTVKVLIIDEISMISGELFDKLDHIACEVKKNDLPFGGIQVICCGDFFQLPPVSKEGESSFCFESRAWKRTMKLTITLQKVFRQKGDLEFIDMLNDMRLGHVSPESLKKFKALERELPQENVEPAQLFSTRAEVEKANSYRLNALKTGLHTYSAHDGGILQDEDQRNRLLANFLAPKELELKKGAQVMMIKNIDESLVNGSLGKVIDFIDRDTYMAYEKLKTGYETEEQIEADIKRVMDREGGGTIDHNFDGNGECDEYLEDTIFDFLKDAKSEDPEQQESIKSKIQLINKLHKASRGQKLPLVRFLTPDKQCRTVLVNPETWVVEDEKQKPLVTRMQLPLLLAWALSIHKSQGQTLPFVSVNLKRVFEKGQAYVAISRAVDRAGLQILNFDETKVFAHHKVIEFYERLSSAKDAAQQYRQLDDYLKKDDPEQAEQRRPQAPLRAPASEIDYLFQEHNAMQAMDAAPPEDEEFMFDDQDFTEEPPVTARKREYRGIYRGRRKIDISESDEWVPPEVVSRMSSDSLH